MQPSLKFDQTESDERIVEIMFPKNNEFDINPKIGTQKSSDVI